MEVEMISDAERREVAERLRFCARETNGTGDFSMYLRHWVNADGEQEGNPFTVQANRKSAERTLEKLADLIDRPTCQLVVLWDEQEEAYIVDCTACHFGQRAIDDDNEKSWAFARELWRCGNYDDFGFCPNCGAEVVS